MTKILILIVMIELFYGCTTMNTSISLSNSVEKLKIGYKKKFPTKEINYIPLMKILLRYVIPDDEKFKYKLKENRMLLMQYSSILNLEEIIPLDDITHIGKKLTNSLTVSNILKLVPKVMLKPFSEIEKISNDSIIEIEKIIKNGNHDEKLSKYIKEEMIFVAIKKGNLRLVKLLVENGASLNIERIKSKKVTPIVFASILGFKDIIDYLIIQNVNLNIGEPFLPTIIKYNDFDLIKKTIEKGVNIDSTDENGNTPLIIAIKEDVQLKIVKYLINNGANLEKLSGDNENILEISKKLHHNKIFNYLKTIYKPKKIQNGNNSILNKIYKLHNSKVRIIKIFSSKDEKKLITINYLGEVKVFDLEEGILLTTLNLNLKQTLLYNGIVSFVDDRKILKIGKEIEIVDIYDDMYHKKFSRKRLKNSNIIHINISDDKKKLLILSGRVFRGIGDVYIWDIEKNKILNSIKSPNTYEVIMKVAYLNEHEIITGDERKGVYIWNIDSKKIVKHLETKFMVLNFYKNSKYLLVLQNKSGKFIYIDIFDIKTMKKLGNISVPYQASSWYTESSCLILDNKVIIGVENGGIYLFDLEKRKNLKLIGIHKGGLIDLIFLPNSKKLISVNNNGFKMWKLQ